MREFKTLTKGLFVICLVTAMSSTAFAQGLYVYPLKNQSNQQEQTDRTSCNQWAIQQSGFDPATAQTGAAGKGAFVGLLTGLMVGGIVAATGGAAGAIAIGAGGGGLIGGIIGNGQQKKTNAAYASYLQAAKTCMTAKGYQVSVS